MTAAEAKKTAATLLLEELNNPSTPPERIESIITDHVRKYPMAFLQTCKIMLQGAADPINERGTK